MKIKNVVGRALAWVVILVLALPPEVIAQQQQAEANAILKPEELDQVLAAIALYPDPLISQILMASTYPLEIVQADRWAKQNKTLKGDAVTAAVDTTNSAGGKDADARR